MALELAKFILQNTEGCSPLKIQKLSYYCVGALMAYNETDKSCQDLLDIRFAAWKYGPVISSVYEKLKEYRAKDVPKNALNDVEDLTLSDKAFSTLQASLAIYGRMSPQALVEQTHIDSPWREAWHNGLTYIDQAVMREFFKRAYRENNVVLPEYLTGSYTLDGIPLVRFKNIYKLAEDLRMDPDAQRRVC